MVIASPIPPKPMIWPTRGLRTHRLDPAVAAIPQKGLQNLPGIVQEEAEHRHVHLRRVGKTAQTVARSNHAGIPCRLSIGGTARRAHQNPTTGMRTHWATGDRPASMTGMTGIRSE